MKSQGKRIFFKVREKSLNFALGQGSFGILLKVREIYIILDIIRFSFKFIERLNKKTENYVKHVMFSVQIAEFKVSEILL